MKKVDFAEIITDESGAINIMLYDGGECVAFLENYDDLADAVEFAKANAETYKIIDGEVVINQYGVIIPLDVAVNLMDDELREELVSKMYCNEQTFFEAYAKAHQAKFDEVWKLSKINPVY